jgi:hypothetical protein
MKTNLMTNFKLQTPPNCAEHSLPIFWAPLRNGASSAIVAHFRFTQAGASVT